MDWKSLYYDSLISSGLSFLRSVRTDVPVLGKRVRALGSNFQYATNHTTLNVHTAGGGDEMMVRQLGRAFGEYVVANGDPDLGSITMVTGGFGPFCDYSPGDVNVYWWYSFGPMDSDPARFHDDVLVPNLQVDLDLVLCGSERIQREAEQLGYDTLYFPIGTHGFRSLDVERAGFGYAGSKGHKSSQKVQEIMGPYLSREDFEWVSHFTTPDELNLWYNTRYITFGLTKRGQRRWGVVNSRVFETLASATPFIIREHPTLDDVLGFQYPYQASNRTEVEGMVDQMMADPQGTLAEFREYARRVRANHDYTVRLERLFSAL